LKKPLRFYRGFVLSDAFGNALGNSIVAGLSSTTTPQQAEKKAKAAAHKAVLSGASPQQALMLEKQTYAQELGGTVNPGSVADSDETVDTGRRTSSVDGNAGFWLSDGNDRAFIDYNSSLDAISGFLGNSAARDLGMKFAAQTIIGHHKAQQAFDDGMNKGFVSSVRPGVRAQQQLQQQTARQLDAMNVQKWQSDQARAKMTTMEKVQLGLDVAGMTDIPVVSQIAELGSAGISLYNGDYVGAGLGVVSMIPIAGKWAESAKMQRLTERVKSYSDVVTNSIFKETGARRVLDPSSLDAWDVVEGQYDLIRANTGDVSKIAENIGWSEARVARIKEHVFFKNHQLDSGASRFDADPDMFNAWNRLEQGDFVRADIDLLRHEIFESKFEGIFKTNYRTAHEATIRSGRTWTPE
jgi:hypothetical protein